MEGINYGIKFKIRLQYLPGGTEKNTKTVRIASVCAEILT